MVDNRAVSRRGSRRLKWSAIPRSRSSRLRSNTYSPLHDTRQLSREMNSERLRNSKVHKLRVETHEIADERRRALRVEQPSGPSPGNANLHDRSQRQTSVGHSETSVVLNRANRSSLRKDRVEPCPETRPPF